LVLLLKGGEPLLLATHLGLQLGKVQILILTAIESHDVSRQADECLTPSSCIIRGEGAGLPLLTNGSSTCFQDATWIISVGTHPPGRWGKRISEDAILQAWPGKTINGLQTILDRIDADTQSVELLTAALTGQRHRGG
jgi:hypothetical protein